MKPFDLKKALAGEPVVTRNGDRVHFLFHDPGANITGKVYARYGDKNEANLYYENGRYDTKEESECDLFMAPTKREGWVNVFSDGATGGWHATKEIADRFDTGRVACCRIEWEE